MAGGTREGAERLERERERILREGGEARRNEERLWRRGERAKPEWIAMREKEEAEQATAADPTTRRPAIRSSTASHCFRAQRAAER